ncbi:MAG: glycine cleavage system aminomethyltransferase GcvT [Candidatus Heimdallarchaeota archaeon]|nr:MAG: glycine cleavage system aminomethyltransferase GcvT [Candidatus Heimdallarchaeota archaeon]
MKTQLYEWHEKNGEITNFSGFKMPVLYSSIKEEHMIVRTAAGLFDVSHMGRMWIEGQDAEKFLNLLVPRDLAKTPVGRTSYTFMLNEYGGFKDDMVIGRIEMNKWLLVWNAGNLQKITNWMNSIKSTLDQFNDLDIILRDISSSSAMFALQGPKAVNVLSEILNEDIELPSAWNILKTMFNDIKVIISGTGYTGENGYEIIVLNTTIEDPTKAIQIWEHLLKIGESERIKPCGLGARDSLRLEAGFPLYGNDINESITPIEANLFFPPLVHLDKPFFFGKSNLQLFSNSRPNNIRVGFIALRKGPIPRPGLKLFKDGKEIGVVSSGGYSPVLNIGIGMGYVPPNMNEEGNLIQFEVRGKLHYVKIKKFPLFDPKKWGAKRKQ